MPTTRKTFGNPTFSEDTKAIAGPSLPTTVQVLVDCTDGAANENTPSARGAALALPFGHLALPDTERNNVSPKVVWRASFVTSGVDWPIAVPFPSLTGRDVPNDQDAWQTVKASPLEIASENQVPDAAADNP